MNDHLLKLMKQAEYDDELFGDGFAGPFKVKKLDPEKFARLIIQECVQLAAETEASYSFIRRVTFDFSEKNIYAEGEVAAKVVATKIKQRFGIN